MLFRIGTLRRLPVRSWSCRRLARLRVVGRHVLTGFKESILASDERNVAATTSGGVHDSVRWILAVLAVRPIARQGAWVLACAGGRKCPEWQRGQTSRQRGWSDARVDAIALSRTSPGHRFLGGAEAVRRRPVRVRAGRRLEKRRCARGPTDTQTAHGGESRTAPLWPGAPVVGGRQRTAAGQGCVQRALRRPVAPPRCSNFRGLSSGCAKQRLWHASPC